MYLLGYDIGSSSIKVSLLDAMTGNVVASASSPEDEMDIFALRPGWAEQNPAIWWENAVLATRRIKNEHRDELDNVKAIGITYQMHGLVVVDADLNVLRPAIIWCDSRAVSIGERAEKELGIYECRRHFLNSPGNFTASKLKWVMENEPGLYGRIYKAMLPGEYIAMKMTGEVCTTVSGLSEGIMWDFIAGDTAHRLLEYYEFCPDLLPRVVPVFSPQGELTGKAADDLGLKPGIMIAYRAGDQLNNAFSLKVLKPGEIAATAGTSGVVYGIAAEPVSDPESRVNTFAHVNHSKSNPSYGVLVCINGTGILYRWLSGMFAAPDLYGLEYEDMNGIACNVPVGSDGLIMLPYGNGAERTLGNRDLGASVHGLQFNIHGRAHIFRAAQEGIVFALKYGLDIMHDMSVGGLRVRAPNTNMFLSPIFSKTFTQVTGMSLELYNTDGSQGAARGAGIGIGIYTGVEDAFVGLHAQRVILPDEKSRTKYLEAYAKWLSVLNREIK